MRIDEQEAPENEAEEAIAEELAEKRGGDDVTQPHTPLDRDDNLEGEPDSD